MGELTSSEKVKYGDSVHNARRFIDEEGYPYGVKHTSNRPHSLGYVWDVAHLNYVVMTQPVINTDSLIAVVSGEMSVSNFPATQPISGTVSILNGKTLKTVPFAISETGTVINAVTGKRIKVYAVKLIVNSAMSLKFRDGASNDLEGLMPFVANAGYVESVAPPLFLFATAAGNSLDLVISGVGIASGRISYWDDDVE